MRRFQNISVLHLVAEKVRNSREPLEMRVPRHVWRVWRPRKESALAPRTSGSLPVRRKARPVRVSAQRVNDGVVFHLPAVISTNQGNREHRSLRKASRLPLEPDGDDSGSVTAHRHDAKVAQPLVDLFALKNAGDRVLHLGASLATEGFHPQVRTPSDEKQADKESGPMVDIAPILDGPQAHPEAADESGNHQSGEEVTDRSDHDEILPYGRGAASDEVTLARSRLSSNDVTRELEAESAIWKEPFESHLVRFEIGSSNCDSVVPNRMLRWDRH